MVLVRFVTKALVGDTVPDFAQIGIDARNRIKKFKAERTGNTPREKVKRLMDEAVDKVEDLIRKSESGSKLIQATRKALDGPRDGLGTIPRRVSTFIEELQG